MSRVLNYLGVFGRYLASRPWGGRLLVFVAGFVVAWIVWNIRSAPQPEESVEATPTSAAAGETMWTCSMHPQIRSPKPGLCPICNMDLIPVEKTGGGLRTLSYSPEAVALMSIETVPVERRYVQHKIRMVGKVDYDETALGYITAWVSGRLDRLFVDFTGVYVNKGDHMVYIYSEELYAAQEELLQALKYANGRTSSPTRLGLTPLDLVASARKKLRLLGLTDEQIKEIEQRGEASPHLTVYAPVSGVVVEKLKQEGERVNLGDRIYTIADLSLVWVHLDAYESDLPWLRYGQKVTITTEAYPGEHFDGRIAFIQPVLDDRTRTVKVRVNLPNESGKFKPNMFVHALVEPMVAEGGRIIDPSLVGKWISPMHPEIIKDQPGVCDKCGMPLVRAESLGYVTPGGTQNPPPLVIPKGAALVTGTRAIVYIQLPTIQSTAEPALQTLKAVIEEGKVDRIRNAFATYSEMLDQPYDQPGTPFAEKLWERFATELSRQALAGQRVQRKSQAEKVLAKIEQIMERVREAFAPVGQPTFEGREIVLGPRVGDYYIVERGLAEGELVVTEGNFKLDAEIQIKAKPSMMTPEGGSSGGGHHHGGGDKKQSDGSSGGDSIVLTREFRNGWREVEKAVRQLEKKIAAEDLGGARAAFAEVLAKIEAIDVDTLSGQARVLWREYSMLLGNDSFEGKKAKDFATAEQLFLQLKSRMRTTRAKLGTHHSEQKEVEPLVAPVDFQRQLEELWRSYLTMELALAKDDESKARGQIPALEQALQKIDARLLQGKAVDFWKKERKNLTSILASVKKSKGIKELRQAFKPLSEEIGVLAQAFGFGPGVTVVEVHCPMAFGGQGAVWYQADEEVMNPYYGAKMLKCADRVEPIVTAEADSNAGSKKASSGASTHQH